MGRMAHLETIAEGTDWSAEQLQSALQDGTLVYPTDDLVVSVAEWMSVDPESLRAGEVKGFGGSGSTDDGEGEEPEPEGGGESEEEDGGMPNPTANADEVPEDFRRQLAAYREKVTVHECKDLGLEEEQTEDLVEVRKRDEKAYEMLVGILEELDLTENAAGGDGSLGTERGRAGAAETKGTLRQLCAQAKEEGVRRGAPLINYVEEKGYEGNFDSEVAKEVYND